MGKVIFHHPKDKANMNKALLIDLQRAADDCGYTIEVTTAITGHNYYTKGGAVSRHGAGYAVDISIINGASYKSNKSLFTTYGHRLSKSFESMGYIRNKESGNPKAVLWYFNSKQAGNHYNHLHVSNRSNFSSTPGTHRTTDNNSIISSVSTSGEGDYHTDEEYYEENSSQLIENKNELAKGIWQIVKVVIDPDLKSRQINDLSLSQFQGSLYNFVQQICQPPFVEFWGDTYGDQYYFIIRVPPFTIDLYRTLPTVIIEDKDVLADNLDFCQEQYSWFQLVPSANYIGVEEHLNSYLPAVFFPEYAEIWGSKPLSITSQYISYIKEEGTIQKDKAFEDLKFLVDINSYLPFTRKGTITINGDRRIKKGMRIHYAPTNEYFYVDAVSNNFSVNDGIVDRTTTLTVSRGMVADFVDNTIEDDLTPNYFNLIKFDKNSKIKSYGSDGVSIKDYKDINASMKHHVALFNYAKPTFDYSDAYDFKPENKLFFNTPDDEKNINMLDGYNELKLNVADVDDNFKNIDGILDLANEHPNVEFELVGYTDSDGASSYNIKLGKDRANTVLEILCSRFMNRYLKDAIDATHGTQMLNSFRKRFTVTTMGKSKPRVSNETEYGRKQNRRVEIYVKGMSSEASESNPNNQDKTVPKPQEGNWRVNREVFMFFLRRQQFASNTINTSADGTLEPVEVVSEIKQPTTKKEE